VSVIDKQMLRELERRLAEHEAVIKELFNVFSAYGEGATIEHRYLEGTDITPDAPTIAAIIRKGLKS